MDPSHLLAEGLRCLLLSEAAARPGVDGLFMMICLESGPDNGQKNVKITGDQTDLSTDGTLMVL